MSNEIEYKVTFPDGEHTIYPSLSRLKEAFGAQSTYVQNSDMTLSIRHPMNPDYEIRAEMIFPPSPSNNKLQDLIENMELVEVLEDRREYSADDLQSAYELTTQEANDLYWMIQSKFDPEIPNAYHDLCKICYRQADDAERPKTLPEKFAEGCLESLHNCLDGWDSEHDRITIERFLSDICLYVKHYGS